MSAQMNYGFSTPLAQAGGIYDLAPYAIDAFINEANDGVMKFGMGVVAGTKPGNSVKVGAGDFEGIVNNRRTNENKQFGATEMRKGCTVGVMRWGRIYGLLAANVEPAYGDKVYMVTSGDDAGCFTNDADDGKEIAGRFLGGASEGIALIELFNQAQPTA